MCVCQHTLSTRPLARARAVHLEHKSHTLAGALIQRVSTESTAPAPRLTHTIVCVCTCGVYVRVYVPVCACVRHSPHGQGAQRQATLGQDRCTLRSGRSPGQTEPLPRYRARRPRETLPGAAAAARVTCAHVYVYVCTRHPAGVRPAGRERESPPATEMRTTGKRETETWVSRMVSWRVARDARSSVHEAGPDAGAWSLRRCAHTPDL